ncbi:prolyl oligopeptidase family serine peptidase [Aquimarina celericrescens]|nr:prolyl oligopeptidase family serine peptidase [Aquimarina celericrescens]
MFVSCSDNVKQQHVIEGKPEVNIYHGKKIKDPYRNLENLEDSTVLKWLKNQGDYAFKTLEKLDRRQFLIQKYKEFDNQKLFRIDKLKSLTNGKFFYIKTKADENVGKLYMRNNLHDEEILLFDPSKFRKETKETYVIGSLQPDWNGNNVVICVSQEGEELSEVIIVNSLTRKVFPRSIKNNNSHINEVQWLPDNTGFVYLYSPVEDPKNPNYGLNTSSKLFKLEEDFSDSIELFSLNNNPRLSLKPEDYPLLHIRNKHDNIVFAEVSGSSSFKDMYYKSIDDLLSKDSPWELLYRKSDKVKKAVLVNNKLVFLTAKNASNYKIARTPIDNLDFETPEVLVAENRNSVIQDFEITKDGMFFVKVKNGVDARLYHYRNSKEEEIVLPNPSGKIQISSRGPKDNYLEISTYGWIEGNTTYQYDVTNNTFTNLNLEPSIHYKDFEDLVVEEIEVPSHDGVLVPVSVIYKKGIKKDGNTPTLFYGYGSYGGSISPFFSPNFLSWVTEGGILTIAHVRGGGEKGDDWHKAGFKTTKPNTWKDMIACTEYMIKEGYTRPEKSAIWGTSAGGIMAGRAMTERPDLYAAVIMYSPSTNLVRSEIQPNGPNSVKEFGTVKIREEFEALLEMDSYHHIKKGVKYPATLVGAGMKDGRVVVWDPAKFIARLQASNVSNNPILFAVDFKSGHGGMSSTQNKRYELYANALAFAFWQTGHPGYQPE